MESDRAYAPTHIPHLSTSSSSSGIDLTGTPAGIAASIPSSPALSPSDALAASPISGRTSFARRRTSWGAGGEEERERAGMDPPRGSVGLFDIDANEGASTPARRVINASNSSSETMRYAEGGVWASREDPFSPTDDGPQPFPSSFAARGDPLRDLSYATSSPYRSAGGGSGIYSTAQPGLSSASLIPSSFHHREVEDLELDDIGFRIGMESAGIDRRRMGGEGREDDEAALTANMSRPTTSSGWVAAELVSPVSEDLENSPTSLTPNTGGRRRRTVRYSTTPSPLRRTGDRLRTISRTLRRASMRVVNMAGRGLDDHVRLMDRDSPVPSPIEGSEEKLHRKEDEDSKDRDEDEEDLDEEELPDLRKALPLRGRTLGFLGRDSWVRMSMYKFLTWPWTEPFILLLIFTNAIVLTLQASRGISQPASDASPDGALPETAMVRVEGYFHSWEDWVIFFLFCSFTFEALARICVSGFLLDPEIPLSALFKSPFASLSSSTSHASSFHVPSYTASASSNSVEPVVAFGDMSTTGSGLSRHPSSLKRSQSLLQRLRRFRSNLKRPFELAHTVPGGLDHPPGSATSANASGVDSIRGKSARARSDTVQSNTPILAQHTLPHLHFKRASFPQNFMRSERPPESTNQGGKSGKDVLALPFRLSVETSRHTTSRNLPYLRQSWTRIDFLAIIGFWGSFILSTVGYERYWAASDNGGWGMHIAIFRALSVLRCSRLLAVSGGTTTIMRSLKTARPLLASVSYFVLFAMILFSIIGIQSFKGSSRRTCHLLPTLGVDELDLGQSCGAYIDRETLDVTGYITLDGQHIANPKGYICPIGQVCLEFENPQGGIASFDTIYFAALQVFIVSSANGWTPLMYSMMDSEFFVSCFFFIICVIVLNFWLINLFVAVITNSFSAIRKDTHRSAFGAAGMGAHDLSETHKLHRPPPPNKLREIYVRIRWCWVFLALFSLVLQATRTVDITPFHAMFIDRGELVLTIAFDVEIFIRLATYLPDWRAFFMSSRHIPYGSYGDGYPSYTGSYGTERYSGYRAGSSGQNILDLVLAISSSIIQIPAIKESPVYPWLTAFQLARFYRVILEIPRMKPLLLAVFGNMYGLANMTLFLLLINYLTALVGVQLLRGDVPSGEFIDWGEIFNAFLATYQVFSSENWTDVLYGAAQSEIPLQQSAIIVLFVSGWMFFANYIVLQMFIAVINENFDVAEEHKRSRQASHFWATQRPEKARAAWIRRLNPYRWFDAKPKAVKVEHLPSNLVLPMQKAMVEEYGLRRKESKVSTAAAPGTKRGRTRHIPSKSLNMLQTLFTGEAISGDVPLSTIRSNRRDSSAGPQDPIDEETERHLEVLAALNNDSNMAEDLNDVIAERRAQKADFIREHSTYDKTFWIFSQKNTLRHACQKLVTPANGERIFGAPPGRISHPIFQLVLLCTVVAGILVECFATPLYRRDYYQENGLVRGSWFDIAEAAFGLALFIEFLIKIVADGFIFTPNAYVRSIWNVLDFLIMIGLVVNLTTGLIFVGGLSRLTRSLKALRALRLVTLVDKMRTTFESLIISGAARILDAALLAILYMIPYAVWGLNIFAGEMNTCNDNDASGLIDCKGEYVNNVVGEEFGFLVPRVWDNPAPSTIFSFDSFRSSLLILFEIVSLEGWIDVMAVAVSITGKDQQPQTNVSQANAIFFLIYNLLGGVVILTLFISIIIGNFTARTGSALLTQPQREWIDLQKLITRQRPSRRPKNRPTRSIRAWCFDRAVQKHGWWSRIMTALFVLHVIALMTQTFLSQNGFDKARGDFFLFTTVVYLIDITIRLYGLGWASYSANGWNIFDIVVACGSFVTIVIVRAGQEGFATQQLQKLFITSIAFKLVQRTNSLNKLFKTAIASLPAILSLLTLWVVLFLFFGILYVEVFSMTKWGSGENRNQNYSTMPNALVMLAFMTTGEGWNQYMHDYAVTYPRCTDTATESDCGSISWAFSLFIAWNLLSMYIFANLFTGVVVESFYYVFQTSGGTKEITREEMRSFKKVWAEFANPKTGLLERSKFVPFFGKLSGIFEVRIYPAEHSVHNILGRSLAEADGIWDNVVEGVDLEKLDANVSVVDRALVKRRKNLYNRLYHEARISYEPGKGISFTNMLMLLAHHKLIVDKDALVLKDLVQRTEKNKLVTDLVDFDRVQSLLLMISHRRRFLAWKEQQRAQQMIEQGLPDIVVSGGELLTPPSVTRDITSPGMAQYANDGSPRHAQSSDMIFSLDTPSRTLQRNTRRISDMSMLGSGSTYHSSFDHSPTRDASLIDDDPHVVLSTMETSMWGEMLAEAAEEEDT